MSGRTADVVVIGAGPYGLGVAAHLREGGADVRVLGVPMAFWSSHMPAGMRIRSRWDASHIAHPRRAFSLDAFESVRGVRFERPMPLEEFIAYGRWYQEHVVPDVDPRNAARVEPTGSGFRVTLVDGETIETRRVVVAAGISTFAVRPPEFDALPRELASHSSEHRDLRAFAGKRVAVVGAGQSAIESAVLLKEGGADVEVVMRRDALRWVGRAPRGGLVGHALFHHSDVGPALVSHIVARPMIFRGFPVALQREMTRRSLVPGASLWLRPRIDGVRFATGRHVVDAARANAHLRLRLDDGSTREVDHLLLATGYRVDISRYPFLAPALVSAVRTVGGSPVLAPSFESSVPGLYFLGAPAALSFGPVLRFVSGGEFATRTLARSITGQTERRPATAFATVQGASVPGERAP
jgi:lysine/ornithine N-monooxygenase